MPVGGASYGQLCFDGFSDSIATQTFGNVFTKPKGTRDPNQIARLTVGIATGDVVEKDPDEGKDPAAGQRGRADGLKGRPARGDKLSAAPDLN